MSRNAPKVRDLENPRTALLIDFAKYVEQRERAGWVIRESDGGDDPPDRRSPDSCIATAMKWLSRQKHRVTPEIIVELAQEICVVTIARPAAPPPPPPSPRMLAMTIPVKVLITGDQSREPYSQLHNLLSELPTGSVVITGGNRSGLDRLVRLMAEKRGLKVMEVTKDPDVGHHTRRDSEQRSLGHYAALRPPTDSEIESAQRADQFRRLLKNGNPDEVWVFSQPHENSLVRRARLDGRKIVNFDS
jgi:hypothetical protein